jgi:hypothetical protein
LAVEQQVVMVARPRGPAWAALITRRTVARGRSGTGKGLGGLRDSGGEAVKLVIDYIKQETLTPLRGLGRYILFGVIGSVFLAIGLVILAVAFLRFLQGETGTTFTGNWSWAPYLICTVVVVAVAAAAVLAVSRGQSRSTATPEKETP